MSKFSILDKYQILFNKILDENTKNNGEFARKQLSETKIDYFKCVFLCGGNPNYYNSRKVFSDVFENHHDIHTIICEDILNLSNGLDLLTFETIIAASCRMILIAVESPGSFCELGTFVRYFAKEPNVVAVVNVDKKQHSFINDGPIAFLKNQNIDLVIEGVYKNVPGSARIELLSSNKGIESLPEHRLLKNKVNCISNKLFNILPDDSEIEIIDIFSFFIFIIDFVRFFRIANEDLVVQYLNTMYKTKLIKFREIPYFKNSRVIIKCMLMLLCNCDILHCHDNLFVMSDSFSNYMQEQENGCVEVGSVLFKRSLLNKSNLFENIRSKAIILSEKFL